MLEPVLHLFRHKNTRHKCQQREKVAQRGRPFPAEQMGAHEHHITGLGIGEHMVAHHISIGILKAAAQRKKHADDECFGHLGLMGGTFHKRSLSFPRGFCLRTIIHAKERSVKSF